MTKNVNENAAGVGGNGFATMLAALRKGATLVELSSELSGVVKSVLETGKKGELTLKLRLVRNRDGESVQVEDSVVVRCPRLDRSATSFYATDEFVLSRENPRQKEFGFQALEGNGSRPDVSGESAEKGVVRR